MQVTYKIAMVGLGSIGKRHLINIDKVLKRRGFDYSLDLIRRHNSNALEADFDKIVSTIYTENETIPDDYDVIFITNPTHLHYDTIKKYSQKSKHLFIEKPVFDNTTINISELSLKMN